MIELLAGVAVAVAALALVLEPILRRETHWGPPGAGDADDDFTPLDESESPKIRALLALKEIEFDRATGKLSDEDYDQLKAEYARAALVAMDAEQTVKDGATAVADDPAEALIRAARASLRVCSACGPRPEAEATFCSECGRRLTAPAA
ncbi:MAG: hypothetical protein OER21_02690 [Gemmatimonadota bacterium]|nr:hypothetical protein [Gemmatimonadota bacterium]